MQIAKSNNSSWVLRGPNTFAAKLLQTVSGIPTALHRKARLRATIYALSNLSDRSLADNGIARAEIPAIAARNVAREFILRNQ
ncbi:MAG: DUF1127 domain-containing protein [Paracoccaceae bacterium]